MSKAHVGNVPWNKNLKGYKKKNIKSVLVNCLKCGKEKLIKPYLIRQGNGKFCSKQCANQYNKRCGENHHNWKGKDAGYIAFHAWVKRNLGKPLFCEGCGSNQNIQWANRSHEYKRDLLDWIPLCVPCHREYDKNFKFARKLRFG